MNKNKGIDKCQNKDGDFDSYVHIATPSLSLFECDDISMPSRIKYVHTFQ